MEGLFTLSDNNKKFYKAEANCLQAQEPKLPNNRRYINEWNFTLRNDKLH